MNLSPMFSPDKYYRSPIRHIAFFCTNNPAPVLCSSRIPLVSFPTVKYHCSLSFFELSLFLLCVYFRIVRQRVCRNYYRLVQWSHHSSTYIVLFYIILLLSRRRRSLLQESTVPSKDSKISREIPCASSLFSNISPQANPH